MRVWRSTDGRVVLCLGDCREVLPTLTGPIHACVTDPPYHLLSTASGERGFMGKPWDGGGVAHDPKTWALVLAALLPGAMLLAFGGTRSWHRLGCAIEDAGFELRDTIMWLHGTGFPKSLDISKAIDKVGGHYAAWLPDWIRREREARGLSYADMAPHFPSRTGGLTGTVWNWEHGIRLPTAAQWNVLMRLFGREDATIEEVEREVVQARGGVTKTFNVGAQKVLGARQPITAPATDAAKLWAGYGTGLKPAVEPILLAMKALSGTFVENALAHGVAGLNIDGCRIPAPAGDREKYGLDGDEPSPRNLNCFSPHDAPRNPYVRPDAGRWPANVVLDEEAAKLLDEQSGVSKGAGGSSSGATALGQGSGWNAHNNRVVQITRRNDVGGASRFFYVAKASRSERTCGGAVECKHPTVKPLDLMRWLVRLVSMPGGSTILDPFMGSGTTGMAAVLEGQRFVGIEKDEESFATAVARIAHALGEAGVSGEAGVPAEDYSRVCWGEDEEDERED